MYLITGAAGFIGSCIARELNYQGIDEILLSDKLGTHEKWRNINEVNFYDWVDREELLNFLQETKIKFDCIIHMGACSSTTQTDADFLLHNNYEYTKSLWDFCSEKDIPFIYASSAATYGSGENGYIDSDSLEYNRNLKPLNKYALSKKLFDIYALTRKKFPPRWAGLKFFNVYGSNEYHKGTMASMVYHGFRQFTSKGKIELFKSYKPNIPDGEQKRDFIYIKDVTSVVNFMVQNEVPSGLYNVGTGEARTFFDMEKAVAQALGGSEKDILFKEMPEELKRNYQYYTQAQIQKLRDAGYSKRFYTLEEGVIDYVQEYLNKEYRYY